MRSLAILLLAALPALAVTASPGAITLYMRKGYVQGAYPFGATRMPMETAITISGTGDWNISRGGDLATGCQGTVCFTALTAVTGTICSNTLATGNGAGTVYLCWRNTNGVELLALGSHTGTLTIGSTTISITLNVLAPFAYDAIVNKPGHPSGCTNSAAGYPQLDTCAITNERPASTAFSIPAAGGSYTDPQFGYTVKHLTASGLNIQYSTRSAFSASSTYVLVSTADGFVHVYNRDTGAQVYGPLPSEINIGKAAWDALNEDILWYAHEGKIKYRTLSTGINTVAADYAAASGSRPAMSAITMDGETNITEDNWWIFSAGNNYYCAVNLTGLTTSNQETKTRCSADLSALAITHINFPLVTRVDRGTGKRYVVLVVAPAGHVLSVGATGLDYEYVIPTSSPDMTVEPHSHVCEDSDGNQGFIYTYDEPYGNVQYAAFLRLSAGTLLLQPAEIGGGMKFLYPSKSVSSNDNHWGCAGRTAILSNYSNQRTARRISGVVAANPCQITTVAAHGYSTGSSVQIGGALGITSINAVHTITSTGGSTYTLDGHNCTGTYTANSAHSALFTGFSTGPNRQELVVLRPGHEVRRVAIHRNGMYDTGTACANGDLCSYYAAPKASISPNGRYLAYSCNFGVPENPGVCVADVGFGDDVRLTSAVDPADTLAVLRYNVPADQGAATVLISASPSLTSPVVNVSDGLVAQSRQYVATGLTAATDYFYRVTAGMFSYTGRFRTLPTLSGTGTLRIERGGGGSIDHGTTSSLGLSGASPLVLTPSRGVYYYSTGAGVVAAVVK